MSNNKYTCNEYREEMILLSLQRQLKNKELTDSEREKLLEEIKKIEKNMDME